VVVAEGFDSVVVVAGSVAASSLPGFSFLKTFLKFFLRNSIAFGAREGELLASSDYAIRASS
jgi:hypothetical protein